MGLGRTVFEALPAIAAVGTLPVGILTAIFVGLQAAGVVFVVGWLLVLPLSAIINDEILAELDEEHAAPATGQSEPGEERDPIEALRERYATGEIDDVEFERRLEDLVATEDSEVPPGMDLDAGEEVAGGLADEREHERDGDRERDRNPESGRDPDGDHDRDRDRDLERERT